ncbi:cupredoxin domain-containing protein [Aquamicrobium segne]|uniref:Cupredoxin domain-containing protein n=1 Tax=Aquamicrobium segne TaxID=469547 RepID=A0ABW0GYD8_9HYPH
MTKLVLDRRHFLLAGAAVTFAGIAPAKAHNGVVHVVIENLVFTPAEIEVAVGQTIEWDNKDPFAHTATVKGGWEVMIAPGAKATKIVEAGDSVEYYCRFHPNMTGRIRVAG